jgi:hypothetical protein
MIGDKVIRFTATRDSTRARTDEDTAMAHDNYGTFATLDEARAALIKAVIKEVAWLRNPTYASDARAAEIEAAIPAMVMMSPATEGPWSEATVEATGLVWTIVRTDRES